MLKKSIYHILALKVIILLPNSLHAQSSITTDIGFGFAGGSGDYAAHYITANEHGAFSVQSNSAYLRAGVFGQTLHDDWCFDYGLDLLTCTDDYTPFYLQQLYANVEKYGFFAEVGAKEYAPTLRNQRLSSGSMLWSGNAHPIPQLRIGSVDFFDIPGTRHWLQFRFDGGYGLFMDDDYLRERYDEYNPGGNTLTGGSQSFLTTGAWMHQKRAHLRTNPHRCFYLAVGMEHAVQFGGTTVNYINNTINGTLEQHLGFMDFVKVLVPASGGDGSAVGDQNFVFGNHLGIWSGQLSCNLNAHSVLHAYVEFPFEDGSGIAKRNGWDGLWGLEYHTEHDAWLSGIVLEYLQTTDQSGAIHWAPQDHMGEMKGEARGADEYYNNFFYCGYAHFGQSMGTPMLKSPIYNADSYLRFTDNRVQAWHAGIEGNVLSLPARPSLPDTRIDYRCLLSYRNAFGTMNLPSAFIRHDLSLLAELTCGIGHWQMVMAYACDRGSLMGDSNTFKVSFKYHGKVF